MGDLISSIVWVKRGVSARHPSKQPLNDADIERIKEIAHVELEDARTELERASSVARTMDQRHEDSDGDDIQGENDDNDDDDESAWVDEDYEPMDEDTTADETAPRQNGDLSEYKLDTYDEEDDGPASSASGHAVFRITTICPAQLLVPSPT